jgi:hypothetical protein
MGLGQATVKEIVEKAVTHRWGIPEFQRGFVWTPQKVRVICSGPCPDCRAFAKGELGHMGEEDVLQVFGGLDKICSFDNWHS